ncbi:MAG: hypothetical protein IT537_03190 [Hyphomicrobiales bacterium]|nr:hypothetical protein [Hyphomicrobiales bacterium]
MTAFRHAIPDFQFANPIYAGALVTYYVADDDGEASDTLATLYRAPAGTQTVGNPVRLDGYGKFEAPIYIAQSVVAEVTGYNVPSHRTGVTASRGIWRGLYATGTVYYSTDVVLGTDGVFYIAADDFTATTLVNDVASGDLQVWFDPSSVNPAIKPPARVATTANITLLGTQTIDGVSVVAGDRVLVKDQSTATQNGIWTVAAGAWTRTEDFNAVSEAVTGTLIFVTAGTVNARTLWQITTADPITPGPSSLAFTLVAASPTTT